MPHDLSPSALKLLRAIADHDTGHGVAFHREPCARWRLAGTFYTVNNRTFGPLVDLGLVDVGNGQTDPVTLTAAGRDDLASRAR
ncbi:hypothetical protein [Streptodolium elevatio]|uniref:Uncharacterized protein n=1 Tax=Streptodolium elevatio TaxID=3157996 RepID=A0ABV3DTE0_9ACTN